MVITLNHNKEQIDKNIMSVTGSLKTNRWRHKIEIKHLLTDDTTLEAVNDLCRSVIEQLERILIAEERWQDHADFDEKNWYVGKLHELIEDFDVLIDDPMETDDLQDEFNYRLEALYDLGDSYMCLKNSKLQKFLWVG